MDHLRKEIGQIDEFFYAEFLGTKVKYRIRCVLTLFSEGFQSVTQGLSTLVEGRLDHLLEEFLVAPQIGSRITF